MHVFCQKYCSYLCFSSIYGSPLFFLSYLCGVNNLIHPVISNSWSARGLLKNGNSSCYCADARGLLPGHFVKGRDSSLACLPPGIPTGPENLESLESRGRYFDGWGGFLRRTEAIVPCWALSLGGGGSRGPGCRRDAEGAENRSRDRGALNRVSFRGEGPLLRPTGEPGSVSISVRREVLKNRLHHPLLLVGGCLALHAFCGLTCLLPTPPVLCLSPSASPRSGFPGPLQPPQPRLASTSPLPPSCWCSLISIPGSIQN